MYKKVLWFHYLCAHLTLFCGNQKIEEFPAAIFWYLHEQTIGAIKSREGKMPLSWHYSLWDFSEKKGLGVSIAIIDSEIFQEKSTQKYFLSFCNNLVEEEKKGFLDQSYCQGSNRSCWAIQKNEPFRFRDEIQKQHGICTQKIIAGFSPKSSIVPYVILDQRGYGSSCMLYKTLKEIAKEEYDIVHLGCKLTEDKLSQKDYDMLHDMFKKIDFIVAAAGNDSRLKTLALPAKCPDVAFDVGSFNAQHDICSFSQFELDIGPKIVMPGQDIYLPLFLHQKLEYVPLSGTSISAAIMTGFLALLVAEFKAVFSYYELLSVIYKSTVKLKDNSEWETKTTLGTIDMRTTFLCLHILKKIKKVVRSKTFHADYDILLQQILYINQLYEDSLFIAKYKDLYDYTTHSLQNAISAISELTIMARYRRKGKVLHKMFDKELLCLIQTNSRGSVQKNSRIRYALNRKR